MGCLERWGVGGGLVVCWWRVDGYWWDKWILDGSRCMGKWSGGCLEGSGLKLLTEMGGGRSWARGYKGGVVDDQVVGGCLPGSRRTGRQMEGELFGWVGSCVNGWQRVDEGGQVAAGWSAWTGSGPAAWWVGGGGPVGTGSGD